MVFFVVAFALLLHVLFWGTGLALLAMPRRWRRFWPMLTAPAGLALQSLVVWLGAYANLPGTQSYAWWSEGLPVILLGVGIWRRGAGPAAKDAAGFGWVGLTMVASLCAMVAPLAVAGWKTGLTTISLGSCDAADYAAGARVFMEFAHSDRTGFLGLTEVVGIASVDNFFDFWLRLNHFTPSALIALNGTILGLAPHEITGLMTMVLLTASLPVVFWTARAVLGFRPVLSVWIALLYGLSPIAWYAVFHVAMGQLLAAPAIALVTWAGVALWRGPLSARNGVAMGGVLAVAYALVLGSYNFILVVSLVPAVAYAGGQALWRGAWARLGRWVLIMLAPLALSGALFAERVAGLLERFRLFRTFDFGWRIPLLSPEGLVGMVASAGLDSFAGSKRVILAVLVSAALGLALGRGILRRRRAVFVALCLTVPGLAGYGYLNFRGWQLHTNASYDAYKLLFVFYPGVLASLAGGVALAAGRHWMKCVSVALVTGFTVCAAVRFTLAARNAPLIVDRDLASVSQIEGMPEVASVNMLVPDMWSRLWANSFLLRKPQYFLTHTYEGRRNTPLRGQWDLIGGLVQVTLPGAGTRRLSDGYGLNDTGSPYFLRASVPENGGWYDVERLPRAGTTWRWTAGSASVRLENPQSHSLRVICRLKVRSVVERDLQVWLDGREVGSAHAGLTLQSVTLPVITLPAGVDQLELRSATPPVTAGGGDLRLLGFAVYGLAIEVLPDGK